ncbi:MAG: hypothetical protein EAZ30_15920 [Betaproteobacteria bacterium]|nr:MAG: hypothetical protein EAZ30_15920 [Betaproteobacteria bacterium]
MFRISLAAKVSICLFLLVLAGVVNTIASVSGAPMPPLFSITGAVERFNVRSDVVYEFTLTPRRGTPSRLVNTIELRLQNANQTFTLPGIDVLLQALPMAQVTREKVTVQHDATNRVWGLDIAGRSLLKPEERKAGLDNIHSLARAGTWLLAVLAIAVLFFPRARETPSGESTSIVGEASHGDGFISFIIKFVYTAFCWIVAAVVAWMTAGLLFKGSGASGFAGGVFILVGGFVAFLAIWGGVKHILEYVGSRLSNVGRAFILGVALLGVLASSVIDYFSSANTKLREEAREIVARGPTPQKPVLSPEMQAHLKDNETALAELNAVAAAQYGPAKRVELTEFDGGITAGLKIYRAGPRYAFANETDRPIALVVNRIVKRVDGGWDRCPVVFLDPLKMTPRPMRYLRLEPTKVAQAFYPDQECGAGFESGMTELIEYEPNSAQIRSQPQSSFVGDPLACSPTLSVCK